MTGQWSVARELTPDHLRARHELFEVRCAMAREIMVKMMFSIILSGSEKYSPRLS